jgi:hypothetical protein
MSFLKITTMTGAVCLAAFLGYKYVTAKLPGYCEAQKRVIPDEEIFVNYLDAKIKGGQLKLAATEMTGREYLANHPDCCWIDRTFKAKFRHGGLIYAIFTKASGYVQVKYEMSDLDKKRHGGGTHYTAFLTVDSCSKTLEDMGIAE